jgi:hypothetical protein
MRDSNGKIVGDITGNAATATSATTCTGNAATASNASLLQGYTAAQVAAMATTISAQSLNTNGYVKFSNGLIIQWGITSGIADHNNTTINFPTSLSNNVFSITITPFAGIGGAGQANDTVVSYTTSSFVLASGQGATCQFFWMAFGN